MLTITIKVNAPVWAAQGVKEWIAMELEKFGDVRVVKIEEDAVRNGGTQMGLFGQQKGKEP